MKRYLSALLVVLMLSIAMPAFADYTFQNCYFDDWEEGEVCYTVTVVEAPENDWIYNSFFFIWDYFGGFW